MVCILIVHHPMIWSFYEDIDEHQNEGVPFEMIHQALWEQWEVSII